MVAMLEPEFFQRYRRDEAGNLIPDSTPLPEGTVFAVTGYARVENFTLVSWRRGGTEEYATGETLYRDRTPILMGGGSLPLYEELEVPIPSITPQFPPSVWDRVDERVGQFGIPPAIALALRDPSNYVSFQE